MELDDPIYRVRRSKRAKRLALRLNTAERVFDLVVPMRCPIEKAYDFADNYEPWMAEKLSGLAEPVPFTHGRTIPFDGMNLTLSLNYDPDRKRTDIKLDNDRLLVSTNKDDPSPRITRWMKEYARDILSRKSHEKAGYINKHVQKVSVRDTRSRWGSCSSDGNLSYSWRLIFAPPEALDYVVAHEIAHLKHMNHGNRFWRLCESLSDDYETGKDWMKRDGQTLLAYGR